jgi:hypothetical protein
MSAERDLERRLADHYATEAPSRAPEWVLGSVLATIDTTRQRRALIRVPWRLPNMNTYAKWAIAAVVVVAVGALGLAFLRPGSAPGVGGPGVPSPSPTPSSSPDPSAPPPLGETFTSTIHGISLSYPTGWRSTPATEPWTSMDQFNRGPAHDHVFDPVLDDHLMVSFASQPLDGTPGETWAAETLDDPILADGACAGASEPITVDGGDGLLCGGMAALWTADRGYIIWQYLSGDEPWLPRYYDQAWFRTMLDTVRLEPAAAVDAIPSASP